jgi:hypothetical protein
LPYLKKATGITQDKPILKMGDEVVEKILFNNNIACSSVMVKKECYNKLGIFDENAWVSPDWEMWARIGKYYNVGHLDIIGCAVIMDNENTHLSAINVNNLYKQQQYYYNKIISYFSENFRKENPLVLEKAEENLKNTILRLSFHYLYHFEITTALAYFKKIQYRKIYRLPFVMIMALTKFFYSALTQKKMNYKHIFELLYNKK